MFVYQVLKASLGLRASSALAPSFSCALLMNGLRQSFRIHSGSHCIDGHSDLFVLKVVSMREMFPLGLPKRKIALRSDGARHMIPQLINTEPTALLG